MKQEHVRIAVTAVAAFVAGRIYEDVRINRTRRRLAKRKAENATRSDYDVMQAIQGWINNPKDNRTLGDVVDEWFVNNRFKQIVKGQ